MYGFSFVGCSIASASAKYPGLVYSGIQSDILHIFNLRCRRRILYCLLVDSRYYLFGGTKYKHAGNTYPSPHRNVLSYVPQWYDFSRKNQKPRPNFSSHPSQRTHKFFDSKGPGGSSTPRSEALEPSFHDGEILEIGASDIIQYAHYGYVYCMLLTQSLSIADSNDEILISGGGDGTIKLWRLAKSGGSVSVQELAILESGDGSVLSLALKDTLLYSGRLEGDVNVWDLDTRQLIQTIRVSNVDILSLAVGSGLLFTGSANGRAKVCPSIGCPTYANRSEDVRALQMQS